MSDKSAKTHAVLDTLQYEDDILVWGSRKVTEIAEEVGQTPFYAYDRARMTNRVNELRAVMPADLHIHYAMKANPMPAVVRHMAGLVDGLDVASEGELSVALATGVEPTNVSFAGPGKRDHELRAAIDAGITINMESEGEMRRIAGIASDAGRQPHVAIRVNPSFELKSSGMKMGGRPSQFGVDAERVPAMLVELKQMNLDFRGFHVFSGSQNLRVDALTESIDKTVDLVLHLAEAANSEIASVNLGGGLGIPYFRNELPIELNLLTDTTTRAVERLKSELTAAEVIMELGRYLVGEAGIYIMRVIDIKESGDRKYVICDGGLHHHLAASGNFGQVLRKDYPLAAVERSEGNPGPVIVVGPLCTPLDLLGNNVTIGTVHEGSLIAILQSGAYGATASPQRFLSHPPCSEIVV